MSYAEKKERQKLPIHTKKYLCSTNNTYEKVTRPNFEKVFIVRFDFDSLIGKIVSVRVVLLP